MRIKEQETRLTFQEHDDDDDDDDDESSECLIIMSLYIYACFITKTAGKLHYTCILIYESQSDLFSKKPHRCIRLATSSNKLS